MTEKTVITFLDKSLSNTQKKLEKLNLFLENAPVGHLKIKEKPNSIICSHVQYREGKRIENHIPAKDNKLAKVLAQKAYYQDIKKILEDEIKSIKKFKETYHPERKKEAFEILHPGRKQLVTPLFPTPEERRKEWLARGYKSNTSYPERLKYKTKKGELRRSKSEKDISNALDEHSDVLLYYYEPILKLKKSGKIVCPDFLVINLITGRVYYWEHFGGFGIEGYTENYVGKMQSYQQEGPAVMDNLLATFETVDYPLQDWMIENIIKQILES